MTIRLLTPLVVLLLGPTPVFAHHAFSAEFNEKDPITLTGSITKVELVNPHAWVYLDVKNPDGSVTNWAVEAGTPNQLLRRGLRQDNLPVGSQVSVAGYRAKNGKNMANGRTVTFLDGRNFFLGATSDGAPKDGAER